MRVCLHKKTGKLIEAQSGNDLQELEALEKNAIRSGHSKDDLELKIISDADLQILQKTELEKSPAFLARKQKIADRKATLSDAALNKDTLLQAITDATTIAALKLIMKRIVRLLYART